MNTEEKYNRSLSFWRHSMYYMNLVQASLTETVSSENMWTVVSDEELSIERYNEITRWSDFNIAVPIFYNFYHALELLLKGFVLYDHPNKKPKLNHDIEQLLRDFNKSYSDHARLASLFKKYITPNEGLLKEFFVSNKSSAKGYYEVLRYPTNRDFEKTYSHMALKYNGEAGRLFFSEMNGDISELRTLAVELGRNMEVTNV
ncbi:hypothetical protein [Neptunomonas qingdaonensis]|uniref:HEPN domain-containing protein n=1 Tax=Neptunomonas qingdaonensis TaxID=1045558 RepID=A0A1I2SHI5_9GAMM|nr:hypothetical protein [Neptunomonas qingdaonensis]SFG51943.1 hypothetical protein SAMN05216175_1086 [Neptunomonas qingdaonensis]